MRGGGKKRSIAYRVALVGICAASLECGKLALAALPNVEVVTLLTALYGYAFGVWGIVSAVVFVCIEPLIYGFGTWIIGYFIYWPLVALVFMLLSRAKVKSRWILTGVALILTVFFGVLSSLVDTGLFMGYYDRFFYRFSIIYMRGISFYVTMLITNAVVIPTLFPPLYRAISRFGAKYT